MNWPVNSWMTLRMARAALFLWPACALAQRGIDADVVVLSDTSVSMTQNDPKNAVVLVTRLFADIVPGKLAAVRLFDLGKDQDKVPHEATNEKSPCSDRPQDTCTIVKLGPDALEKTVDQHLLRVVRQSRGDTKFKSLLTDLLHPGSLETKYEMSWATIERLFRDNASPREMPRVVVWLSDGDADDWPRGRPYVQKLLEQGVAVRALVFKTGKTEQPKQVGIEPLLVDGSPSELMKAFADAFRYIVQAPFRTDGIVAKQPAFTIKPHMEDVWVVTYGDESLSAASVTQNSKTVPADYAMDHYNGSAYRVAYMKNPAEGSWEVHVTGGGPDISYAVIQRSTITPVPSAPNDIYTGIPFPLVVTLRNGENGQDLTPADLPEPVKVEAQFEGQAVPLTPDASGKYTGTLTARQVGPIVIRVYAHNSFLDRTVKVTLQVRGYFRYTGGPLDVDFGSFKAGTARCQPVTFSAEQQGSVPFELRPLDRLPDGLRFEFRGAGKRSAPGGNPIPLMLGDEKKVCLIAGIDTKSFHSDAHVWANLAVRGMDGSVIPLRMTWTVRALTFWEQWGKLILLILLVLLIAGIIYGYIKPYRFPPGLAICYAPEMSELDDQTPQPVRMWRGVGIGFYRDARACLQDNYRINGQLKGAVAVLQAGPRRAVLVKPASRTLYREVGLGEWDQVAVTGRRAGQGEVYRVGDSGPFFRLSMRASS